MELASNNHHVVRISENVTSQRSKVTVTTRPNALFRLMDNHLVCAPEVLFETCVAMKSWMIMMMMMINIRPFVR